MTKKLDFCTLNLQDALDLAILIEEEAQERYQEFANQIGSIRTRDAGDFFVFMAANEAKHALALSTQRKRLFGTNPSAVTIDMMDEIREAEAPDYHQARSFMSRRHALEVALASEVKAYHFFNDALASIKKPEVRKLFFDLKEEEVVHQNLIKNILHSTNDDLDPEVDPGDVDEPAGL